jgi:hypothetical protein
MATDSSGKEPTEHPRLERPRLDAPSPRPRRTRKTLFMPEAETPIFNELADQWPTIYADQQLAAKVDKDINGGDDTTPGDETTTKAEDATSTKANDETTTKVEEVTSDDEAEDDK